MIKIQINECILNVDIYYKLTRTILLLKIKLFAYIILYEYYEFSYIKRLHKLYNTMMNHAHKRDTIRILTGQCILGGGSFSIVSWGDCVMTV